MLLSLKCHNCGATVYFDNNEVITRCSHCGAHLKEMTEYTLKAVDLNIKQQSANIDVGRENGIANAHNNEVKTRTRSMLIAFFGMVGAMFLLFLVIKWFISSI